MKNKIFLLIFCIFCVACNNANKKDISAESSDIEIIKVDFKKEYTKRKFPNINNSMTIQRLEDNEDHPIGYIDKILVDEKNIYILDRSKAKSLFIYDRNGRFLNVLNAKGGGPGEFIFPQDFDVDKKTGNITIMDNSSRKILVYSPQGLFIEEFKYDFMVVNFIFDNENNILLDNGNIPTPDSDYRLKKIDTKGKLIESFFPSEPATVGITFNPRTSFQRLNNKIYYLPTMSNCIYSLEGNTLVAKYQIDFGNDWPTLEFCESVKKTHPLKIRELMFENNYVCFLNCIQTEDVIHFDFYKEKNYSLYYNKITKQSLLISMEDENISFPLGSYNNEFIFVKYNDKTGMPTIVFYTVDFQSE